MACHRQHEVKHPPSSAARIVEDSSKATTPVADSVTRAAPQAETPQAEVVYTISRANQQAYTQAVRNSIDPVLYDTTVHQKQNGVIRLPLANSAKPAISFADTLTGTDDTAIRTYLYLGQLPSIGQYVLGGGFWEHGEYYLVDQHTGAVTTLWGVPVLSPSGRFVANPSMSYGMEGDRNGLQVWVVAKGKRNAASPLAKIIEIDQQVWIPEAIVWENENTLLIQTTSVEDYWKAVNDGKEPPKAYTYLRLKIN